MGLSKKQLVGIDPVTTPKEVKTFRIGNFALRKTADRKIWIETPDGEGGSFSEDEVEKALEAFYSKYF